MDSRKTNSALIETQKALMRFKRLPDISERSFTIEGASDFLLTRTPRERAEYIGKIRGQFGKKTVDKIMENMLAKLGLKTKKES